MAMVGTFMVAMVGTFNIKGFGHFKHSFDVTPLLVILETFFYFFFITLWTIGNILRNILCFRKPNKVYINLQFDT